MYIHVHEHVHTYHEGCIVELTVEVVQSVEGTNGRGDGLIHGRRSWTLNEKVDKRFMIAFYVVR